jgi:cell wall-associated NlpC family hydrolase
VSRRSLRETAPARKPHAVARRATPTRAVAPAQKPSRKRLKGGIINGVVIAIAAAVIATMALPAYAFNPTSEGKQQFGASAIDTITKTDAQSVSVSGDVAAPAVSRDQVSATTEDQLQAQQAAAAAEQARQQANTQLENYAASYSGPSAADYLANPPYPNFSLAQVYQVAYQYYLDKVPYVFGGATPAGFDCSGYVMFVYAQFGISLPHSVSGQAALGTRISEADAQPGDVVIMDGHEGFYAGNGNIMDAPDVGRDISLRPIWTSDFYIVRFGI